MFLANDVKAHATLQRQNADGKRAYRSLMISYPSFRARFPNPDRHRPCRAYPALLRGPDEGGNKKIFRKEGQRSIPNRHGTRLAASVVAAVRAGASLQRLSRLWRIVTPSSYDCARPFNNSAKITFYNRDIFATLGRPPYRPREPALSWGKGGITKQDAFGKSGMRASVRAAVSGRPVGQ